MCRPVVVTVAALALLAVRGPAPARAQADGDAIRQHRVAELEARLDRLDARLDSLGVAAESRREAAEPWRTDSARVGPFVVVAREGEAELLAGDVARTLEKVEARLGKVPALRPAPVLRLSTNRPGPGEWSGGRWTRVPERRQMRLVTLERRILAELTDRLPPDLHDWLEQPTLDVPRDWVAIRDDLVAGGGARGLACLEAGGHDCLAALGLTAGEADPGVAPSPEERRARARLRSSVLVAVLGRDPAALARLMSAEHGGSAVAALERAAGVPLDRAVAAWRDRLVAAGPGPGLARQLLASLAWILLFTGLATRSTRWRMG